jgi:hypothetical protein
MIRRDEIEYTEPKASIYTLIKTEQNKSQPTERHLLDDTTFKERSVHPRQHLLPCSHGRQQRTRAVHMTMPLHWSHTQFPVGTSKKRPRGDSQRALRHDIALGTKAPHDVPAKMSVRLGTGAQRCDRGAWLVGRSFIHIFLRSMHVCFCPKRVLVAVML